MILFFSRSWRPPPSKRAKQFTHVLLWDQEMPERPPFVRWNILIELLPQTDIVQRFLGRGHEATAEIPSSELPRATVNSVTVYGQPKYLVLLDTDITTAADGLTPLQVGRSPRFKTISDTLLYFRLAVMWSAWCMIAQTQGINSSFLWRVLKAPTGQELWILCADLSPIFLHHATASAGGCQQKWQGGGEAGLHIAGLLWIVFVLDICTTNDIQPITYNPWIQLTIYD